ncbi:LrgB family protein [Aurantimonas sp. 22II-16-19i]|uniref:LrgB family protein n=1 Tax=Aurantimonas sp. 22II-16-19i TaxID=1317114 RepID=UPI0009F7A8D3|nr:LrgB family protein [Aurantimonas sp. 22II-16-19i]ORE93966.1 LrgB family protein [Aurantimonas sp. 22II-16-19i]
MLPATISDIWVYLSASPLLALTMTLVVYQGAQWLYQRAGRPALLNPVLVAVICLVAILVATGTSYQTYFEGAQFIHFLLGPATVALAIPLYRQFDKVRRSALALIVSLLLGSLAAMGTALAIGYVMGLDHVSLVSLAPKSVTAPVAMGIADKLGGLPSLTAVFVIVTGILGGALGPLLLDRLKIGDPAARGFALGTASHGIGTARALQESEVAGAFSGLAMGLNALATAILLPLIWSLLS